MKLTFDWGEIEISPRKMTKGDMKKMRQWESLTDEERGEFVFDFLERVVVGGGDEIPVLDIPLVTEGIMDALRQEGEALKNVRASSGKHSS